MAGHPGIVMDFMVKKLSIRNETTRYIDYFEVSRYRCL